MLAFENEFVLLAFELATVVAAAEIMLVELLLEPELLVAVELVVAFGASG